MRKLGWVLLATMGGLGAVVGVNMARFAPHHVRPRATTDVHVRAGAAERLAGAIRIPTLSPEGTTAEETSTFAALHGYLRSQFPATHGALLRETIGDASLLYSWPGSAPSLGPLILLGHLDVVPVEPGTEARWTHPPFSGAVADGFVWGRGTMDDKSSVLAALEAVETLVSRGFRPQRTVYMAFGHDEESGGYRGAAVIAEMLADRGVRAGLLLDEGGVIADGMFPGLTTPVALVGIAEKGSITVQLTARTSGGHASMPPARTAIGALSAAVTALERQQMPARLAGPTRALFDRIGPLFPFVPRAVFANLWLTEPLLLRQLSATPSTNASIRTTTAVTMFNSGVRANVLAAEATATVNFRVLPGDTTDGVLDHVRRVVGDGVAVTTLGNRWEPSDVSSTDSEAYRLLEQAIAQSIPDVAVAPYLVPGATDARHYRAIALQAFRFLPLRLTPADVERLHGTNERVAVADYERAIAIVQRLIEAFAGSAPATAR